MHSEQQLSKLFTSLNQFAAKHSDIKAIGVVGSYAREAAKEDSDIEVVLLVSDPWEYLENTDWVNHFGKANDMEMERHGMLTLLRVWYTQGLVIEFAFTTSAWANLPVDPGTARVVREGFHIVYDPKGILTKLIGTERTLR